MTYIRLYDELLDTLDQLPDDTAGRLVKAILAYAREPGAEEDYLIGRDERLLFPLLKGQVDRDMETQENPTGNPTEKPNGKPTENPTETHGKTQRKAESARENGKKGGRPKTQETHGENPTEKPTENPTSSSSLPPSSPSSPSDPSPCTPNPVSPITPYSPPLSTSTATGLPSGGGEEQDDGRTRDTVVGYAVDNLLTLSPTNLEELVSFKADLPDDVICHAVDVALAQGKRNWAYVRAILNRYVTEGLKTLGEIKAQEDRHTAHATRSGSAVNPTNNPALNYQHGGVPDDWDAWLARQWDDITNELEARR